jgi:hypothetical protein
MKNKDRILLNYNAELHKLAIEKAEAIEQAFNDLVQYTESNTKIKIENLEKFEEDPIEETIKIFWDTFKDGFSAPIDQRKALTLTTYEISVAQSLYAKYLQLKSEKPITDKERYCTYVNPDKEEFYKDAKNLENTIKEVRAKYPHYNFQSMHLVRCFDFFKFHNGLDFSLKENSFT